MEQEPTPPSQGGTGDRLLDTLLWEIRVLTKTALSGVGLADDRVQWTERRWDAVDLTATWSRDHANANVHAWIVGNWPLYGIRFEGAVWEDDEASLRRRLRFLTGPCGSATVTESGTAQLRIEIPNREALVEDIAAFVHKLQKVGLTSVEWEHKLTPPPTAERPPRAIDFN